MRAILIDPVAQTVVEYDLKPGLAPMYEALGCACIDIRSVGRAPNDGTPIDLICDDEGRLIDGQHCFRMGGRDGVLIAGRALLVSNDGRGETVGTTMPLVVARAPIEWLPEGFDYTPPPPTIISFSSLDMLQFLRG